MIQTITPNPDIPCKPGWCLAYVNEAFGVPKKYGSATAAWYGSGTKHTGRDFPAGCWVPVWYALAGEPNGHVVLLAPDGSVYSTSDPTTTPRHHPSLANLEAYYAYYGYPLTYRGWTEDVEDTAVVSSGITLQGTITPLEDDMALSKEEVDWIAARVLEVIQPVEDVTRQFLSDRTRDAAVAILNGSQAQEDVTRQYLVDTTQAQADVTRQYLYDRIGEASPAEIVGMIPEAIAAAVLAGLTERLSRA